MDRLRRPIFQVLPVIGLLLQAPFESNVNFMSVLALARWIGNPIASLSYVFWNIKVTGKCALMVDMALPYEDLPAEGTQCAYIRDSLYILSVMNQCKFSAGALLYVLYELNILFSSYPARHCRTRPHDCS